MSNHQALASWSSWKALGALALVAGLASCSSDDGDSNGSGSGGGAGQPSGGSSATGGSSSTGGSSATGGSSSTGGSSATGGSSSTGGSGGSGGTSATGGAGGTAGGTGGTGGTGGGSGGSGGTGTPTDSGLPVPPGDANVPQPSGAVGGLEVVDWAGFTGAVSYTFDDSNSTQISNYAALNELGVPYTFYLQTGKSESSNQVWAQAVEDGHELGNHTKSHSSDDDGSDTDEATQFIEDTFGVTVYTMAAPNGSGVYTNIAKTRFLINRGVSNAIIQPNDNSDPFTLPCYIPPENASTAELDGQVTTARNAGGWRVVLVHGFTGGSDGAYLPVPLNNFLESVQHSKDLGDMWLDTVVNIGAYWRAQKAITAATPTTAGGETTYTWQLPDHFPPGKYVRVTVTGGTVKQNGTPLTWDPHGYYEVALDPESLTISP